MKNNFRFIFPRLIGATVIVGLASLIMVTLFKLMLGILVIGGVVAMFRRIAGRSHSGHSNGQFAENHDFVSVSNHRQWSDHVTVNANPAQKLTIVPIN